MSKIEFKINGQAYTVGGQYGPDVSLNDYIRTVAELRGTKAMCHEGGCGACVVAVRAPHPITNEIKIIAVNSCLVSVLSCHGWEITTVEGIGNRVNGYHEIQRRLANFNGTQCGFCTPGWIMNMYSLYEAKDHKVTSEEIENSFAGNMCRCTGYRSIADAFKSFATDADQRLLDRICDLEDLGMFKPCGVKCDKENCKHKKNNQRTTLHGNYGNMNVTTESKAIEKEKAKEDHDDWCLLEQTESRMIVVDCGENKWYKAYSLSDVFEAMSNGVDSYKFIAGNTGQGVFHVTDYPKHVIDISNVTEIKGYSMDVNLILGAGMPLAEMMDLFLSLSATNEDFSYLKAVREHMDLVAHIPVRNIGTIGGNLMLKHTNNHFQSDVFLLCDTVGAMITIASSVSNHTTISMLDFLNTDMNGKIVVNVMLPPLSKEYHIKTYKIMPRQQNAHAAVNSGFLFKINETTNLVESARLVFGSIAPHFHHATNTETVLVGRDLFTNETIQLALQTLEAEIKPEDAPPEPSVAYRKMLALALFYKAILYLCPEHKINQKFRSGGNVFKRSTSHGTQTFDTDKSLWPLGQPIPKLEALVQCAGEATFANDMKKENDELFGSLVLANVPPGSIIKSFDASKALTLPGVVAFYSAQDIPGDNSFTPTNVTMMVVNEEIFCSGKVLFYGQPAGIIVANREKMANKAAKLVKINYSSVNQAKPLLLIDDVLASNERDQRVRVDLTVKPTEIGKDVYCVIHGEHKISSQYHYTMETQVCVTKPTEDGLEVHASTQWMNLTNVAIAQSLKVPVNSINVVVRRLGGGYGSKISRATQIACMSALVTHFQRKTCRVILPLETNMTAVGKRCSVNSKFEAGVNRDGQIQYLKVWIYEDAGSSWNEAVASVTVMHLYSCYNHSRWYVQACSVLTDGVSTTFCRAPGSTEGVAMIEYIMERIAYNLKLDPLQVRLQNMKSPDTTIRNEINQLKQDSDYDARVEKIKEFNRENRWRKRAMKIIPINYDLGYYGNFNSIVSIYHADGSIVIIHGGIEMGQGINTKVAQVAAHILGAPLKKVSVKSSSSFTSPNAIVTGGSIGSECVSFATMKACEILRTRLDPFNANKRTILPWEEIVLRAYNAGIDLQASYMYSGKDGLANYGIFAAAILEVEIDILTGNHDVRRVDILEDIGKSMSPEIDIGQIEGAFVMNLGYWTSEKLIYDSNTGELLTNRTWTYKPPGIKDIPADMRIYFLRNSDNPSGVLQSKATGEPASCLAVVITHAIREAVREARLDAGYQDQWLDLDKVDHILRKYPLRSYLGDSNNLLFLTNDTIDWLRNVDIQL